MHTHQKAHDTTLHTDGDRPAGGSARATGGRKSGPLPHLHPLDLIANAGLRLETRTHKLLAMCCESRKL